MNLFEATDPEHFAYEPLVIKRVSKETEEASERLYDHVEQLDKKSSLPGWLGAVQTISLLAAGILTVGIFNGTGEVTLAEGFANAPGILHWLCNCMAALGCALYPYENESKEDDRKR